MPKESATKENYTLDMFQKSVKYLKGVGPSYETVLGKKNIKTVFDLITFFPREYEDRTKILKINEALKITDKNSVVFVEVVDVTTFTFQFKRKPMIIVTDDTSLCEVPFYGGRLPSGIEKGVKLYITGRFIRGVRGKGQCRVVEIEKPGDENASYGRIVPIYPLTEGLTQKKLRLLIEKELVNFQKNNLYELPKEIKKNNRFMSFTDAVVEMHFPKNFESLNEAKRALIFEEFSLFQFIHLKERRPNILIKEKRYFSTSIFDNAKKNIPFTLTEDQINVLKEIMQDLISDKQMFRLLQGDVGSGKTVVAILSSLIVAEGKYQTAFLSPTEILTFQHYKTFKYLLKYLKLDEKIKVDILTSSKNEAERGYTLKNLREGKTDIIIGTHSLLSDEVVFKSLGLSIVDEQQRFGVFQRDKLLSKGKNVDYLLMSATPIPQSLALTLYGELDLSVIKTMPKNKAEVLTKYKEKHERDHTYKFLKNRVLKGEQGYVVFPLIETDEENDNNFLTLVSEYQRAKKTYFEDIEIAMIHGKMDSSEKEYIMNKFSKGEIKILFSTTVVEVGVDNKNATVMIIEGAERFGLSQIHQLRGRVGRGEKTGYCYLVLHSELNDKIKDRIETICSTTDGFKISERDLELRGSGEFLGERQSGLPEFKIGSILKDTEIMKNAKDILREVLSNEVSKDSFYKNNTLFLIRANYLKIVHYG